MPPHTIYFCKKGDFMEVELIRRSHSVGKNTWHIEWCTKYRHKMMQKRAYGRRRTGTA